MLSSFGPLFPYYPHKDPRVEVSDTVNQFTFHYTAGSFFQNNPYVLPHMVQYVVGKAKATNLRYLVDAYCGGGLFCLSASRDFEVSKERRKVYKLQWQDEVSSDDALTSRFM